MDEVVAFGWCVIAIGWCWIRNLVESVFVAITFNQHFYVWDQGKLDLFVFLFHQLKQGLL